MSISTPTALSGREESPTFQVKLNEVVFTCAIIQKNTILKYAGKNIRFVDCVFEEGIKIPSSSTVEWSKTSFSGPCKFGDAVIVSGVENLWDGHVFGSWCEISGTTGGRIIIGNKNSFGFGTIISAGAKIGDENKFDSGAEIGNRATIGNKNIFGRNSLVSTEEIVSIGNNNFFQTGSQVGFCEDFYKKWNQVVEEVEWVSHEWVTFERKEDFPAGSHFKNCIFLQSCTFGNGTTFEGWATYFNKPCKFWDRMKFHIHNFWEGHTVGSWGHIQYFHEASDDKKPTSTKYGVQIGNGNSFWLGLKVDNGAASFGNENEFDSGARFGNFTRFGSMNTIGRYAKAGKEIIVGTDNAWRPGCSIESFAGMGGENFFDTQSPSYDMAQGATDLGTRTDTSEPLLTRARRSLRRILS